MISENERRDWIEVGVHATLAKVYWVVVKILVVSIIIFVALIFFSPPVAVSMLFMGTSVSMFVFLIVSECTVKADKISREWA